MSQTTYNLHLKGFVGGADFDRNYVDYVLAKCKDKPVNVLIDSLGGSVATALSIASAFRQHGDVSVHFVGLNASAATIASLGAKKITMDANAMYLVHKCSADIFEMGTMNADQLEQMIAECGKTKKDLDKLDINIASMYSGKCKKQTCNLLDLMKAGGWLTAQEAKEWGFVDEITNEPDEGAPKLTDATASAMAAVGMPIPSLPVEDGQSAFSKFIAALTSIFKGKEMNDETQSTRIAELTATVAERDKTIADLQSQIAALGNEIAELKEKPAEDTKQVIDDGTIDTADEQSLEALYKDFAEARKIMAEIS